MKTPLLRFSAGLISSLLLISLIASPNIAEAKAQSPRRPGAVLYKVKDNLTAEDLANLKRLAVKFGLKLDKQILNGAIKRAKSHRDFEGREELMAAELLATNAVEFAEPDYLTPLEAVPHHEPIAPSLTPNDPNYSSQWHHAKIGMPTAWNSTIGTKTTKVVHCDTGVQTNHLDLQANLVLPGFNTVDNTTNVEDQHGHGTSTAGTLAAVGGNGIGITGIAWNLSILPVKVSNLPDGAAFDSDMAECIRWGADQGAKVATLSYDASDSSTVASAATYFRSKGGLLVMAAGNAAHDFSLVRPDNTNFLMVGSVNKNDMLSSFSNFGKPIDLVAPGEDIGTLALSNGYQAGYGTSYSAPITAGVLALIYSIWPNFTPTQVENFVLTTTVDLGAPGEDNLYGKGRINAAAAIAKAVQAAPATVILDNAPAGVQNSAGGRTFTGTWCKSGAPGFYGVDSLYSCGSGLDTYRFTPNLVAAKYDVYIRWTTYSDRATTAPVSIRHQAGTTVKTVNMRVNGGTWLLLGRYSFTAGTAGYVEISDLNSNGPASADAVRFVPAP